MGKKEAELTVENKYQTTRVKNLLCGYERVARYLWKKKLSSLAWKEEVRRCRVSCMICSTIKLGYVLRYSLMWITTFLFTLSLSDFGTIWNISNQTSSAGAHDSHFSISIKSLPLTQYLIFASLDRFFWLLPFIKQKRNWNVSSQLLALIFILRRLFVILFYIDRFWINGLAKIHTI